MKLFNVALAGLFASSLSLTAFAESAEQILGVTYDAEGITYQVQSGGCTSKDDFDVLQLETYPVQLKLIRHTPDLCEAFFPYGTEISYTYAELGLKDGDKAVIANPFDVINVYLPDMGK